MAISFLRGHRIHAIDGEWFYSDTNEPTVGNPRGCGYCGRPNIKNDHDACIGELPGVMNACCGHGEIAEAYVQFNAGGIISGNEAVFYIGGKMSQQETMLEICKDKELFAKYQMEAGLAVMRHFAWGFISGGLVVSMAVVLIWLFTG